MADTIRQVDYFYMMVTHKTGEGAKVLRALKGAGVSLFAFTGFPAGRRAQLDFFPAEPVAFKSVMKANRWKGKNAFEELAVSVTNEDSKAALESSREFRERFTLRRRLRLEIADEGYQTFQGASEGDIGWA